MGGGGGIVNKVERGRNIERAREEPYDDEVQRERKEENENGGEEARAESDR